MSNEEVGTTVARRTPSRVLDADTDQGWDLVARKAKALSESSVIPREYQGKPQNCLIAMEMAQRTDIPVLAVMQNLHVIQGRPTWSSQFLIAAVNRSGRFSPLRFRFQGKEGSDQWGCRAVAMDLEADEELVGTLITIKMAKDEGWYGKNGSKWQTMPEQMLRYRSAAFWARSYSPELAVGLHTSEEAEDIGPSEEMRAEDLNARIAARREGVSDPGPSLPTPAPVDEEDESPPSDSQVDQLRSLMDKAEVDAEDAEVYELLISDKDGPGVRKAIRDLQKQMARDAEQAGLDV